MKLEEFLKLHADKITDETQVMKRDGNYAVVSDKYAEGWKMYEWTPVKLTSKHRNIIKKSLKDDVERVHGKEQKVD